MLAKYKYGYFKICVYVAYAGLRISAHQDSPDDIHSAVENENTVSAYFTSKQILPFGFAEVLAQYWVSILFDSVTAMLPVGSFAVTLSNNT